MKFDWWVVSGNFLGSSGKNCLGWFLGFFVRLFVCVFVWLVFLHFAVKLNWVLCAA